MEGHEKLVVSLWALLTVALNGISCDEDVKYEQVDGKLNTKLREKCETVVISESVVIVNCSHCDFGSGLDISNIDSRVTTLDLSSTEMTDVHLFQDTNAVKNLVYLNLSNNELSCVDLLKTVRLETLRYLDLSKNKLRKMPSCDKNLVNMKLDFNKITSLDIGSDILKVYGNLQKLSVRGNLIELVNCTCDLHNDSSSLTHLDLSSNRIRLVDKLTFKALHGLIYLNLSYNSITHMHDGVFKTLINLEKLDLSHNDIEFLAANCFEMLKDLKFLDLSFNRIHTFPISLPMTDWFDISFNKISVLPESFSTALYPQAVFFLGGNPFLCNCDLLWLKEYFDTRKYLLKYLKNVDRAKFTPVCEGPDNLKGKMWDVLDDAAFECSRQMEKDRLVVKENVEQVLTGRELIEAKEIGENFVIVQWNIPPDLITHVELSYHIFGKKKDKKEVVLPSSVTSFKLKKLQSGTPYVVCVKVTLTKELEDCIEIFTKITDEANLGTKSTVIVFVQNVLKICWTKYYITALSIGLLTLIYYFCLRGTGNK